MKIERIVHDVEARLLDLGHRVLGGGPGEAVREAMDELEAEMARRKAALQAAEAERDALNERLRQNEEAVALIPSQVESSFRRGKASQAMRQALELERRRQELAHDRAALPRLEQTCWSLQFQLRLLQRRWNRLRLGLEGPG
jgi:hypothetical protein